MTAKRIFITGASGCIGHYIVDLLIENTPHELYLLLRNPDKLKVDIHRRPGIHILPGSMGEVEQFSDLLKTMNVGILAATSWGDPKETFEINVTKTLQLMNLFDPGVCEQILYFSTASILNRQNQPLPEAGEIGTDYIRSKYDCFTKLGDLAIAPHITALFPTLVFGGDENKPYSHLSSGLAEVAKWMGLARFFTADGSFHFMHGYDIAQVVGYLVEHPAQPPQFRKVVLGNPRVTAQQMITEFANYLGLQVYFQFPLTTWLANFFIAAFRLQMAAWDRFSMNYRHFYHESPTNPATLGLKTAYPTLADILKATGITKG